jgi:predicted esterase
LIPTTIHGRVLVREDATGPPHGLLVGFHGYLENAAIQMARMASTPLTGRWTLMSVQGLHRTYRGRSRDVVASWMTSEDREVMIADNIAYIDRAIESVPQAARRRLVYLGFSQGVAMAFRAAVLGRVRPDGVVAVGGDVPPELLAGDEPRFPSVLLARGERDEWYTQSKLDADLAALASRGVAVQPLVFDGGHEWNDRVTAAAGAFIDLL